MKASLRTVRHHKKGWLKEELIGSGKLDGTKEALQAKIWADYNAQKFTYAHSKTFWEKILIHYTLYLAVTASTKNVDVPKNHFSLSYLLYAYDLNTSTFKRLRLRGGASLEKQVPQQRTVTCR